MQTQSHDPRTNQTGCADNAVGGFDRLMPLRDVKKMTGLCESTIWWLEKDGKFPARRRVTPKRVAWRASEIQKWLDEKPITGPSVAIGKPIHKTA